MSFKFTVFASTVLATLTLPALAEGDSASLPQLVAACGENTMCTNQQTGEGMLFIMRHPHRTQNLLCQQDGNCVTILAKGQRIKIYDGMKQLKAQ
jgi:hypothetical protein